MASGSVWRGAPGAPFYRGRGAPERRGDVGDVAAVAKSWFNRRGDGGVKADVGADHGARSPSNGAGFKAPSTEKGEKDRPAAINGAGACGSVLAAREERGQGEVARSPGRYGAAVAGVGEGGGGHCCHEWLG